MSTVPIQYSAKKIRTLHFCERCGLEYKAQRIQKVRYLESKIQLASKAAEWLLLQPLPSQLWLQSQLPPNQQRWRTYRLPSELR